jgi:hypothetical protein
MLKRPLSAEFWILSILLGGALVCMMIAGFQWALSSSSAPPTKMALAPVASPSTDSLAIPSADSLSTNTAFAAISKSLVFADATPSAWDTPTFSGGIGTPENVVVSDPVTGHELVTVHAHGQARSPKVHPTRATANPDVVMADKVHATTLIDTQFKILTGYGNPKGFCAKECKNVDECFAVMMIDDVNHVQLDLPCVNGKLGTWEVTKLP